MRYAPLSPGLFIMSDEVLVAEQHDWIPLLSSVLDRGLIRTETWMPSMALAAPSIESLLLEDNLDMSELAQVRRMSGQRKFGQLVELWKKDKKSRQLNKVTVVILAIRIDKDAITVRTLHSTYTVRFRMSLIDKSW